MPAKRCFTFARGLLFSTRKPIVAEQAGLSEMVLNEAENRLRIAHFVQRYPPALGGSEAYFARLSRHLTAAGDAVTVFTSNALDLEAFWSRRGRCLPAGARVEDGGDVRCYPLWPLPAQRWLLKPPSL